MVQKSSLLDVLDRYSRTSCSWQVYDSIPRTSSHIECWHRKAWDLQAGASSYHACASICYDHSPKVSTCILPENQYLYAKNLSNGAPTPPHPSTINLSQQNPLPCHLACCSWAPYKFS